MLFTCPRMKAIIHYSQKENAIYKERETFHILTLNHTKLCQLSFTSQGLKVKMHNKMLILKINKKTYHISNIKFKTTKFCIYKSFKHTFDSNIPFTNHSSLPSNKIVITHHYTFISLLLLIFVDDRKISFFLRNTILFLINEPIGIKQNKIISHLIGKIILDSFSILNCIECKLLRVISLLLNFIFFTLFIFKVYFKLITLICEMLNIFQGKNYNKVKKRTERMNFKFDRIIIASFLFSLIVLFIYNIVGYYLFFLMLYFAFHFWIIGLNFFRFMMLDLNNYVIMGRRGIRLLNKKEKIYFGILYAIKMSVFCQEKFLISILTGNIKIDLS